MIPPFATPELELRALQDRGAYIEAKLFAMRLQKQDIHSIGQLESQHRDCLKYIAIMWGFCDKTKLAIVGE